ncbi:MAG: 3'-5' exonuclease [Candidatus Omnitrophica bacterium]|nr:3'-5' exonuclease [Candidatus Omnitrophota bacterium]MDE2009917.1 3'-5' exonuclease [Candidatus Omnitrophota bacterium]MDE2215005.1 3'-5' exonuclease [Candidatus Omnitrophota bacterium]MDE2232122.1 3'-5' exonuclease [Candidatus Omnitrophota bacterium]
MNIKLAEFVIFDVETTGLSPVDGDRIIEIAAMKVKGPVVVDKFYSLVNPQRTVPLEATQIHSITTEMLVTAPPAAEVLPQMIHFIGGACVAGHNVRFDLNFLCYELSLLGRRLHDQTPAIDTLKMARDLLPYLSNHKLSYLARCLGVAVDQTHRAMADVELTVAVFLRLMEMAGDKDLHQVSVFLDQFGVEKPSFRLNQKSQESLF